MLVQNKQKRRENSLKYIYFNRYLLFRYSLAALFFGNLYWLFIQFFNINIYAFVPVLLLVIAVLAIAEQFKMYGTRKVYLSRTRLFFTLQLLIQVVLIVVVLCTNQISLLFPIFANTAKSKLFLVVVLGLGILISFFNLRRMKQVMENRDRAWLRYQQLEKLI